MIFELFIITIDGIIRAISYVLPNYSSYPYPAQLISTLTSMFAIIKRFVELPIIRVLYDYFLIWFTIWLILIGWNVLINAISSIPLFHGLRNWKIK